MDINAEAEQLLRYRAKAELRKRAKALRATIPTQALAERSARICDYLLSEIQRLGATRIATFWPIEGRNEVDLRPLDAQLRTAGRVLAYPSIDPDTRVMSFRLTKDPSELEERGMGFQEPPSDALEAQTLDLIIVPALQLDLRGHRIGSGAGFYDATIPRWAPPARTVGVGFRFQLVAEVPDTPGDVPLDAIITDGGTMECERVTAHRNPDPERS